MHINVSVVPSNSRIPESNVNTSGNNFRKKDSADIVRQPSWEEVYEIHQYKSMSISFMVCANPQQMVPRLGGTNQQGQCTLFVKKSVWKVCVNSDFRRGVPCVKVIIAIPEGNCRLN